MRQYAAACSKGDLDRAIEITEDVGDLPDGAALQSRLNRRKFFDSAAAQKASWAAAKFLRVLPEACVDVRTFNMALR